VLVAAIVVAAICAGAAGWWAMRAGAPSRTASAPASTDLRPTVAVLPLVSLEANDKGDYFADGLTEDVISALGRFSDITVRSRNAVY
jgi:TolB-like protein